MFKSIRYAALYAMLMTVPMMVAMDNGGQQLQSDDNIAEAIQAEAVFTSATDSRYISATYGCGPCVAVGGYDPTNRFAFVVHFANFLEVKSCGETIFSVIKEFARKPLQSPIQIYLRGGEKDNLSVLLVQAIRKWISSNSQELPMEIVTEDLFSKENAPSKSIMINSRTGNVGDYNPLLNKYHRTFDSEARQHMFYRNRYNVFIRPIIIVAYRSPASIEYECPKKDATL